jgi:hypothetical protein
VGEGVQESVLPTPTQIVEVLVDTDLDTLAAALYVSTDDLLKAHLEQLPQRPTVGIVARISDAELIVLAVMQALLGYRSATRLRPPTRTFTPCSRTCRASRATTSG